MAKEDLEEYFFLDVREEKEFEQKNIFGSHNLPHRMILMMGLPHSIGHYESKIPKDKKIVLYCETGKRAKMVEETLQKKGYEVINLLKYIHAEDFYMAVKNKRN